MLTHFLIFLSEISPGSPLQGSEFNHLYSQIRVLKYRASDPTYEQYEHYRALRCRTYCGIEGVKHVHSV